MNGRLTGVFPLVSAHYTGREIFLQHFWPFELFEDLIHSVLTAPLETLDRNSKRVLRIVPYIIQFVFYSRYRSEHLLRFWDVIVAC